jgi:type I restriction enzyme S subunit
MTLETFFQKFDQFADAPDTVPKMRKLVLELAVRGRLTSALPNDGTVPSAIEFRATAAVLANSLGLRSPKEAVEEAESPFDVPSHWRWMALADIGAAQTGTTPSKADHEAFNGDIPFIKPADILPNSIDYSNESLTRHGAESGSRLAPSGSLLMVCIGTIGKCNLIDRECAFNQQINSLTPVAAVESRYLLVAARSRSFQDAAWAKSSSTTIAILNKGKWLSIPVPIPPLPEQKRIVAKVDELMALCDRLEAQQQEREEQASQLARASLARFADAPTPANLEYLFHSSFIIPPSSLRKSILTLAAQGKLVPQDPNDEPAEEILRRCKVDLKRWAVAPDEERQAVPDSWTWIRFAGVGEQRLGKMLDAQKNRGELKPYLRNTNVQWMRFELDDIKDMRVEEREVEELRLKTGDLLICEGGEPGRCAIWRDEVGEMYFQKAIHRVRPSDAVTSEYLALNLQIDCANGVLAGFFTGATIKHLTGKSLASYPVPIPPLAEQRRIVAKVEQLMALVDALEKQLAASRATAANLLSALVSELTGTPNNGKVSVATTSTTGRRGRPPKS